MENNRDLGSNTADPYEHQLLEMFKSCDSQRKGYLNNVGLEKLCDKLQLDDAKDQLIECLLGGKNTVTFPEFRDALLTLLGSGLRQSETSREPSPEREVSPKFVFGQKKYGRRSRPESTDQDGGGQDIRVEESDYDTFLPSNGNSSGNVVHGEPEKSPRDEDQLYINKDEVESQSRGQLQGDDELRAAWERLGVGSDGYLDKEELALVCRAVGMELAADEIVNEVFTKLDCDRDGRISFNEFLHLFRSGNTALPPSPQHTSQLPPSSSPPPFHPHHLTSLDVNSSGYVSADSVIELWEMSGVPGAANLLQELGMSGVHEVSLSLLNSLLDEELRNLRADIAKLSVSPLVTYLSAALSLSHVQMKQLRNSLEQMTGERDKLRSDLAEANHRATLLAQEVDDRHARMERSTQVQVKLLEQRHAEQVKQLGLQLVSEREQLTSTTIRLEKKLADVQEEEMRLRSELTTLQTECANMEKENRILSEQLCDYEASQKRAEEQQHKIEALQLRLSELESSNDLVSSFVEELAKLKDENTKLRDRNDELTIQVESLSSRLTTRKQGSCVSLEGGGGGTKRRGHSPPGNALDSGSWGSMSPSPRQGKVRRCCTENDLSLDNVRMEGLAICQPLRHSESGLGADLDTLDDSLTLSNCSDTTISFKVGSDSSKDADVEKLQAQIIELERMVEQYRLKLAVFEFDPEAFDEESEEISDCQLNSNRVGNKKQHIMDEKLFTKALVDKETLCSFSDFNLRSPEMTMETEIQTSIEDPRQVDKLEKHCQELESKLSNVQLKILEMINDKKSCDEENCNLKEKIKVITSNLRDKSPDNFNDGILWESCLSVEPFERQLPVIKCDKNSVNLNSDNTVPEIVVIETSKTDENSVQHISNESYSECSGEFKSLNNETDFNAKEDVENKYKFTSLSQFAFEITNNLSDSDSKDNKELSILETKPLPPSCLKSESNGNLNGVYFKDSEVNVTNKVSCDSATSLSSVNDQLSSLINENKLLKDKCNELESCLEMMRNEYEKCEDYWQSKLEEERRIFDQEQKLSDNKFLELENKIREYVEMFGLESEKTPDGRLPTIDEKDSLERQFIDLEEEFEDFRRKCEAESSAKDKEIMDLKESITSSVHHFAGCEVGIQTEVSLDKVDCEKQGTSKPEWQQDNQQLEKSSDCEVQQSQCYCSCHQGLSVELRRVQHLRSRLQSECKLLTRKRDLLLRNVTNLQPRYPAVCERDIMQNLAGRLHHQELRCRHLQSALKYQQRQMEKAIQVSWEQHQSDLVSLKATLNMTQEKLQSQMRLTKDLMERLTKADILVKDLFVENGQLIAACQHLEKRYSSDKTTVTGLASVH